MVESFKILAIRRRGVLRRFFSFNVDGWYVDVEFDDGRKLTLTTWNSDSGWPYYIVMKTQEKIRDLLEWEKSKREKEKVRINLLAEMKQYEGKTFPIRE